MIVHATAKINIGLQVKNKREDGYHNLETVFFNLKDYYDVLEILPSESNEDEYVYLGREIIGEQKDNLVYKAVQLMKSHHESCRIPLKIILLKNLPMGAGLGGGSSNAAHIITGFNEYFNLGLSQELMEDYALTLGSDCPFFIHKNPCVAEGRGEIFRSISLDLSSYSIQVVTPDIHISTAMAFHNLVLEAHDFSLHQLSSIDLKEWKGRVFNDFERNVFDMFPEIGEIKDQMYSQGALYASMSGTGSSIYGIFNKNEKATINSTVAFKEFYCR